MTEYHCENNCCKIKVCGAVYPSCCPVARRRGYCRKAGVFIYDPETDRVLLVQSRGQLWGSPKGTLEVALGETSPECAIREVKEETGLEIKTDDFTRAIKIKNRAVYYYMERPFEDVYIQNGDDNDANGITWIKIQCLEQCVRNGQIVLNQHCKILFKRFLNIVFPKSDQFTLVTRKK